MRRIAALTILVLAGAALLATSAGGNGSGGDYLVRAYFDNAGFLVDGEEVRIAGANVGVIEEVTVARPGEAVTEDGEELPGKAVAVLKIEDEGFTDFLDDASCIIRPQSLLGEKFVECEPTKPRAASSEPPPPLSVIPEGEIGEGQHFLPLENNGKQVDIDLVNNIMREPEVDRFRLILNDLGAGFAARGDDLGEVIERANPALKETDRVLAILARQNRELAQLAADSDRILTPLARERGSIRGFINNANAAGEAAAERRDELAAGLERFPPALRELRLTMLELQRFADAGIPLANDLRVAAPAATRATEALAPFARQATGALTSLGEATQPTGDDLVASQPVVRDLGRLGKASGPGAKALNRLLTSFRKESGIDYLMQFILNGSNTFNGFDQYGHFLRAFLLVTNCVDYVTSALSGCQANWGINQWRPPGSTATAAAAEPSPAGPEGESNRSEDRKPSAGAATPDQKRSDPDSEQIVPTRPDSPGRQDADAPIDPEAAEDLLEYLTGDGT